MPWPQTSSPKTEKRNTTLCVVCRSSRVNYAPLPSAHPGPWHRFPIQLIRGTQTCHGHQSPKGSGLLGHLKADSQGGHKAFSAGISKSPQVLTRMISCSIFCQHACNRFCWFHLLGKASISKGDANGPSSLPENWGMRAPRHQLPLNHYPQLPVPWKGLTASCLHHRLNLLRA